MCIKTISKRLHGSSIPIITYSRPSIGTWTFKDIIWKYFHWVIACRKWSFISLTLIFARLPVRDETRDVRNWAVLILFLPQLPLDVRFLLLLHVRLSYPGQQINNYRQINNHQSSSSWTFCLAPNQPKKQPLNKHHPLHYTHDVPTYASLSQGFVLLINDAISDDGASKSTTAEAFLLTPDQTWQLI